MGEGEEDGERHEETGYVEASEGFDHPNVNAMDDQLMLTMNNERIVNGYIKSADVPVVKAEVEVMGAMERLYAGGYNGVDTARAINAGVFTLQRAVEVATDGFKIRLDHSQYNYEVMSAPVKRGGFLSSLNPFRNKEQPVYQAEPRR